MSFRTALVLGTGTLPLACAVTLKNHGLPVKIFDMDEKPSGLLKRRAEAEGIPYEQQEAKSLFRELSGLSESTLLVSAINPYILPKYLLDNTNITAINCHQALLPRHPGRNAEMWALYEGDEKTGITWHILTNQVDAGDILIQKELPITESLTSYLIFREQIRLAEEGFKEMLPALLDGTITPVPQEQIPDRILHYSWEVPNEGMLNADWTAKKISAFLRAMDYSILNVVPSPRISIEGSNYIWKKYKITHEDRFPDGISMTDGSIFIQKTGMLFELCKYKKEDY